MKVPGKGRSPGSRSGMDAREPQRFRPLLIVLVLLVIGIGAVFGPLFFASYQTRNDVRRLVQGKCGLSSTAVAGEVLISGDARVPYVDSTGAHTAIVYIGSGRKYFLATCGR